MRERSSSERYPIQLAEPLHERRHWRSLQAHLPHWRSSVQSQRFAVEFDRRTVGIAVRVPGGFAFFSSVSEFDEFDGCIFPRARSLERQLRKAARARSRRAGAPKLAAAL
jgi:hypothetical protein